MSAICQHIFDLSVWAFARSDVSENVYRCHLDFIRLSKIIRGSELSGSKLRAGECSEVKTSRQPFDSWKF